MGIFFRGHIYQDAFLKYDQVLQRRDTAKGYPFTGRATMVDYIGHQFGNYQLLRLLGKGAFAEVYLAEHRYLEVPAAIKVLHVQMESVAHALFRQEAYTIAHLQHPHIVRVLDFGIQDDTPFLVMEYCPNGTLRSIHPKGTCLPPELIVCYVKQIAAALDYAHQQHVIHRDVKPENLLLNAQGKVVLSDFGIAVVQQTLDSLPTYKALGTPLYMAPEQIQRKPCAASDQYAVGVLVYEWLTGGAPFRGSLFEVWSQHLHQPPPRLRELVSWLPLAVEDAVLGAMAKDPQQRFACVQDFAEVLEDAFFATQLLSSGGIDQQVPRSQEADAVTLSHAEHVSFEMRQDDSVGKASAFDYTQSRVEGGQEPIGTFAPTLKRHNTIAHHDITEQINRLRLLRRVRAFWITGVLEHSLHGTTSLALGLQEQPDAVANPWHLVLQSPRAVLQRLPAGTCITQIYDTADGELLILGAPGSGKTTLLLELARDLLDRAEQNEHDPIPVVFNLSTWAAKQQCLTDWLAEELMSKYQVPRKLGKTLVDADQILPLLDGLDEVAPKERTLCIGAINVYRQEHGWQPLVVCSRRADYLAQTMRVQLGCAVGIQPLTEQQIDDYLVSGGESLFALRVAMHQDETLRELTCTPLMLSILTLTYRDISIEDLLKVPSLSERQRLVFEHYVRQMLTRRRVDTGYTLQQITHWLSWLAQQLAQRSLTVFYIDRMQPHWLDDEWLQQRYPRASAALIFGLIGSLSLGPPGGLLLTSLFFEGSRGAPWFACFCILLFGLISGSCFGLLNGALYAHEPERRASRAKWSWKGMWQRITRGVLNGLLAGLLLGLPYGLSLARLQDNVLDSMVMSGAITWLLAGLVFGLIDALLGIHVTKIQLAESFVWSWTRMGRSFIKFLFLGLVGSFLFGLILGLIGTLSQSGIGKAVDALTLFSSILGHGLQFALVVSPLFALISGLLGGLAGGLSGTLLDERDLVLPNQGIRRSAYHSALIGLVSGLVGGILAGGLTKVTTGVQDPKQLWPLIWTHCWITHRVDRWAPPRRGCLHSAHGPALVTLEERCDTLELFTLPRLCSRAHPAAQSRRRLYLSPSTFARLLRQSGDRLHSQCASREQE
jgi:serine/threonine protein kinase/DNA polymerase III delta prime subunit